MASVLASPRGTLRSYWDSSIGKKQVMAVTGLLMLAFLLVHMLGNLKIFFGPKDFDAYAGWLRTIGEPVLHGAWYLWIQRVVLLAAVLLHITAAAQLSKRDLQARPIKYSHGQRAKASFATRTMRWGGVILALFIIWHILDLTAGKVNPHFIKDHPYHNIVADFQTWWINIIYIVAMIAVGLHIFHGFRSAAQTLGNRRAFAGKSLLALGTTLAIVISVGFIAVPVGVMIGLVD
ncbi:succinate dehydrogenase cytochrome b subunit [Jatrophihabitans telluris]|uniref:Succinate dehydrogenase cytochrome b subunit n=1 Tax=Jatrophihabitans telluris TaxID=2038343 RepID=A0ABY4QYT9_9ACTN|nr:succinate dehydrogenase cytochrome b subunit [Jatrophihabitans telluris]UQX88483.1 succinate dehydrogenase cytochrome b subunit [Jatrophihabitans telluris]